MLSLRYVRGILMRFDTTHEYYFSDPCIHYVDCAGALMISDHGESTNRIVIEGVSKDVINKLRLELNKEHLEHVNDQATPTGATATEGSD